jgi:hypothetical protein
LDSSYKDALKLSTQVAEYFKSNKSDTLRDYDADLMASYMRESNRITASLMKVMTWCLIQKGVQCGEITREESLKTNFKNEDLYDQSIEGELEKYPENFANFIAEAQELYLRTERLDRLLHEEFQSTVNNPVHDLLGKIAKESGSGENEINERLPCDKGSLSLEISILNFNFLETI